MSMITKETSIDGMTVTVTQLPAMKALRLMGRLGKTLGPALAKAAGAMQNGGLESNVAVLGDAVHVLFDRLSPDEMEQLTRELLETATVTCTVPATGQPYNGPMMPVFNTVFQGRMPSLLKTLKFAFEVNYGNFFDGLRDLAAQHLATGKGSNSEA